jgi:hypothetical protein
MATPRSKYATTLRKLRCQRLIYETILEKRTYPGSVELAEKLGVTPRTIRNYFKERRQELWGPDKIWLSLVDEQGREVGKPEFLTYEECARKTNLSVRELRREIWMKRRDRIAAVRGEYAF